MFARKWASLLSLGLMLVWIRRVLHPDFTFFWLLRRERYLVRGSTPDPIYLDVLFKTFVHAVLLLGSLTVDRLEQQMWRYAATHSRILTAFLNFDLKHVFQYNLSPNVLISHWCTDASVTMWLCGRLCSFPYRHLSPNVLMLHWCTEPDAWFFQNFKQFFSVQIVKFVSFCTE